MSENNGSSVFITPEELFQETPDEAFHRSSNDIPVKVTLHKKEFLIRELPIRKASVWEKKATDFMQKVHELQSLGEDGETKEEKEKAVEMLPYIIGEMPEQLTDLVLSYIDEDETERDWILDNVTRFEILTVAKTVFWLGLPMMRGEAIVGISPLAAQTPNTRKVKNQPKKKKV